MDNFMTLKIKAVSANEAFARSVTAAFCVGLDPTVDQLNDLKTAVSEAVTNSIVHGYEGKGEGEVEIRAQIEGKTLHIEIIDSGVGIADIEQARQPFYTTKPEQERSGMGFTVMESFMDSLEIHKNPNGGLIVKMSKNFGMKKTDGAETSC